MNFGEDQSKTMLIGLIFKFINFFFFFFFFLFLWDIAQFLIYVIIYMMDSLNRGLGFYLRKYSS